MKRLKRLFSDQRGSQIVEFSLCAMIFLTMICAIIDLSRAMWVYHYVTYWSEQGSRYAIVRGSNWTSSCASSAPPNFTLSYQCQAATADVQNYVQQYSGMNRGNLTVTTTWPGTTPDCTSSCSACTTTNRHGCQVKVLVSYKFKFITPFILKGNLTFTATSIKVIQE